MAIRRYVRIVRTPVRVPVRVTITTTVRRIK